MENTEIICEENLQSKDLNDPDTNISGNEKSSMHSYGRNLEAAIQANFYKIPDIPKKYIEPIILDTSLPYIPLYAHLKTYDLKPVKRPKTPPLLYALRSKTLSKDDTESCLSSKTSPLTEGIYTRESSGTPMSKENGKSLKIE
ncbi:uncharacterized protein LOC116432874 [Nomia melanderi]|uniref:uncharacterized protein LOC116432874 n=1 Tax=Nomia melanderi TaxID=2448451 RepID=UPI0013040C6B|nr:uncharacterized protein LOC116432874 [Nomia melanderi]XP_031846186.1 uncharacterized protein LOC116432874 [Nomia melanderi]